MAEKAEGDFFALLREEGNVQEGSVWKDVGHSFSFPGYNQPLFLQIKRKLYDDPRYDAVGSASLREELFNTFCKGHHSTKVSVQDDLKQGAETWDQMDEEEKQKRRKEKSERAVREREQKVKVERDRLEADIGRSRMDIYKEEGERDFLCANYLLPDELSDCGAHLTFFLAAGVY